MPARTEPRSLAARSDAPDSRHTESCHDGRRHGIGVPRLDLLAALVFGIDGDDRPRRRHPRIRRSRRRPEPQAPPPLTAPKVRSLAAMPDAPADDRLPDRRDSRDTRDRGRRRPAGASARVYVPHEPPPPIAERRSGDRPGPRAVWTSGYWEWDADRGPLRLGRGELARPAGRHGLGARTLGPRRPRLVLGGRDAGRRAARERPSWRTGPPGGSTGRRPITRTTRRPRPPAPISSTSRATMPPVAAGDRLAWVPGFWAAIQPGWDWIPARWVRRPDGWDFREGHWIRDPARVVVGAGHRATRPPVRPELASSRSGRRPDHRCGGRCEPAIRSPSGRWRPACPIT